MGKRKAPPTLPGWEVLPPMNTPDGAEPRRPRKRGKAKGKTRRRREANQSTLLIRIRWKPGALAGEVGRRDDVICSTERSDGSQEAQDKQNRAEDCKKHGP